MGTTSRRLSLSETLPCEDPAYRAMQQRQAALQEAFLHEMRTAQMDLLNDLAAVGIRMESVWDLVNTQASYPQAIPVHLKHFQRPYPPAVREGIAPALAVPEAASAWDVLLDLFNSEPSGGERNVKWALACALSGAATDAVLDGLLALVRDKSVGENRLALLSALGGSKRQDIRHALEELRADPQLKREIRILIGSSRRR